MSEFHVEYEADSRQLIATERLFNGEYGASAIVGKDVPPEIGPRLTTPKPDEIDSLLASISATGYASECVEIVERWIEERYGVVGDFTFNERLTAEHTVGVEVSSVSLGPDGRTEERAVVANEADAADWITDHMIANLHERYGA